MKKISVFFFILSIFVFAKSIEFNLNKFYKDNYAVIICNEVDLIEKTKELENELSKHNFEIQTLIDAKTEKILGTLEDLSLIFSNQESRVIIFFIGKSQKVENEFFYPTYDGKISAILLQKYINNIKAKNILLIFDFPFINYYTSENNLEEIDFSYSKIGFANNEQICAEKLSIIKEVLLCLQGFGDLNDDGIITAKEMYCFINKKNKVKFSEKKTKSTFILKKLNNPFDEKIIPQISSKQIDLFFINMEKNKTAWFKYQGIIKYTYQKVLDYESSKNTVETKILLWQYFIDLFTKDNPYTEEDNFYFQTAKNRRDSLKKENKITSLDFKPPVKLDFNMSEIPIETLKELKLKWDKTQEIMEDFYRQTLSFENQINLPSYTKKAWGNFLLAFPKNNPFTNLDDTLRKNAENKILLIGDVPDISKVNLNLPIENSKNIEIINEKYNFILENKKLWENNFKKMKDAFAKMLFLSETNEANYDLWKNFLETYEKDNPYSKEDNDIVKQANLHLEYEKYKAKSDYKPVYYGDTNLIDNFVVIKNNNIYNFNEDMKKYLNHISKVIGEKNNMLILQIDDGKNLWFKENLEIIGK